jgi:hypothetical protein
VGAVGGKAGDIIGLPVEAACKIGKRDIGGDRPARTGADRQSRPGGQARRHFVEDRGLAKAGAAQRFEARRRLQDERAFGAAADHRLLLGHPPGRRRGAAQMDAATQRAVDQAGRGEQIGVAVALDDPVGKAGDDRALRLDAAGDALEADVALAGRDGDPAGFADQRVAVQPFEVERRAGRAARRPVDGDVDIVGPGRGDDRLGVRGGRAKCEEKPQYHGARPAHRGP